MNEYVLSVAFAIIFCVGINLLVPSSKYMGIMKIICGVFVVYTVLTPVKKLVNYESGSFKINEYIDEDAFYYNVEKSKNDFEKAMTDLSPEIISDAIGSDISEIHNNQISAELTGDTVYVTDAPKDERKAISEYIRKQYGLKTVFR